MIKLDIEHLATEVIRRAYILIADTKCEGFAASVHDSKEQRSLFIEQAFKVKDIRAILGVSQLELWKEQ